MHAQWNDRESLVHPASAPDYMREEQLRTLQLQRLRAITKHAYDNQALFRERMDERGVSPADVQTLDDIRKLPFTQKFDLIFCRNVMIYFDKATQQNLINRYWDLLDSGGILFTGHSESLTGIEHKFNYVQPTIYAKP